MPSKKQNRKQRRHKDGVMGRSDIPYGQRLRMQYRSEVGWGREHGARVFMYCWSVAAHELKGKGYKSLVQFAARFREIDREFYASGDIEYSMDQAKRRLRQMGIDISGEIALASPVAGRSKRDMQIKHNIAQATQAAGICASIAANDVWGWAEGRIGPVLHRAGELMDRYAKEGDAFLLAYLEKLGFAIVDGHAVGFVDENDEPVRQKVEGV